MDGKSLTHAGCVVYRDDRETFQFLIISSSTRKHWVLPKGHIDPGEAPEITALRELNEETGIIGEIVQPLSIQKFDMRREKVIVQYYLVRRIGETIPLENRDIYWEDELTALARLSFDEARNALKNAIESMRNELSK